MADHPVSQSGHPPAQSPARNRRWAIAGLSAGIATAGVAFCGVAGAHGRAMGPAPQGGWLGGWHDADPAVAARRLDAMVSYLLAAVDATAEQRARIAAIFRRTAEELKGSRQQHMQARRQTMELLTAPVIDRAALEKLRGDQIRLAEMTSQRMLQALVDSAEVLTTEQRAQLQQRWQQRRQPR
jgi:periplasmic protein CpxP/Spy